MTAAGHLGVLAAATANIAAAGPPAEQVIFFHHVALDLQPTAVPPTGFHGCRSIHDLLKRAVSARVELACQFSEVVAPRTNMCQQIRFVYDP
ncbi:hypothetical protein [Mesorhizobium sp. M0208]|uniref:hypothetical protein n=1 Tax=Mesorhizobium sp. M0208 TaxID=2956916 RepID=UPI0033358769